MGTHMVALDRPRQSVTVTGDIVVDHHIYEGARGTPAAGPQRGMRDLRDLGGGAPLKEMLVRHYPDMATMAGHPIVWLKG
jgi:hypothetical protein